MHTRRLPSTLAVLLIVSLITGCQSSDRPSAAKSSEWQPLFNGRDLSAWYTNLKGLGKENDPNHVFQVHDGMIHVYKDAADQSQQPFGYLCTVKDYGDCRIRFDVKWGEKRFGSRSDKRRDSGCLYFVWGEDPAADAKSIWPASIECQIQENDFGDVYAIGTGCSTTVDPATKDQKQPTWKDAAAADGVPWTTPDSGNDRIVRSVMLEKPRGEWNTVEIVIRNGTATHIINGTTNMKIDHVTRRDANDRNKRVPVTRGRILFQAEGAEVMYRNIEISEGN
jgi:hypothetical protein